MVLGSRSQVCLQHRLSLAMAMKRKSGQGGKAAKAAKTTKAAPNGAEFEHVKKVTAWFFS